MLIWLPFPTHAHLRQTQDHDHAKSTIFFKLHKVTSDLIFKLLRAFLLAVVGPESPALEIGGMCLLPLIPPGDHALDSRVPGKE